MESVQISDISDSILLESPRPKSKTKIPKSNYPNDLGMPHTPKPEGAVANRRVVAVAVRTPHAARKGRIAGAPRTATQHAASPCFCTSWVAFRTFAVIAAVMPVVAPLPHIPRHIIQPITVRREPPHRRGICPLISPTFFPVVGIVMADVVSPRIPLALQASSDRILLLGFGGKPLVRPFRISARHTTSPQLPDDPRTRS